MARMEIDGESVTALLMKMDEIDARCCKGITGNTRAALVDIKGIVLEMRKIAGGFRCGAETR